MPITPADIDALIQLLRQDPALRERVFAAIAPEEFLALPAKVDRLANEVATLRMTSEERFARIEAVLERLVEHQARTEEEFAAFREAIGQRFEAVERELAAFREATERRFEAVERELAAFREATERRFEAVEKRLEVVERELAAFREATERRFEAVEKRLEVVERELAAFREATERRFEAVEKRLEVVERELAAFREATERRFEAVEKRLEVVEKELTALREGIDQFRRAVQERFAGVENKLASLLGWQLQEQYAKHIYAYFGDILRKLRLLTPSDIDDLVRPVLSSDEVKDLFLADIIAQGRLPNQPEQQVYLVMEVSHKVEEGDVARARRRADLLRRAGVLCLAVVGGQEITEDALLEAKHSKVLCTLDGSLQKGWQEIFMRSLQTDSD